MLASAFYFNIVLYLQMCLTPNTCALSNQTFVVKHNFRESLSCQDAINGVSLSFPK